MGMQLLATGSYVPDVVVTNEDLQATHGFDPDWIVQRTGILERRHAPPRWPRAIWPWPRQTVLERAGVQAADIDLLIVATATPDMTSLRPLAWCKTGWTCVPGGRSDRGLRGLRLCAGDRRAVRGHWVQQAGVGDWRGLHVDDYRPPGSSGHFRCSATAPAPYC